MLDATAQEVGDDGGRRGLTAPAGWTLVALVVALCFLAGAVGWTLGQLERPPGESSADVGFLRDMRTHHEGAIVLAGIQLANGSDPRVHAFAEEIHLFQAYEAGIMDTMLREWGHRPEDRPADAMGWMLAMGGSDAGMPPGMAHSVPAESMPGLASEAELDLLGAAGPDTDEIFVALMVDHHAAGIEMAKAAISLADDPDVRELARRMVRSQELEIYEMAIAAEQRGFDLEPDGVDHDVFDGTIPPFGPRAEE